MSMQTVVHAIGGDLKDYRESVPFGTFQRREKRRIGRVHGRPLCTVQTVIAEVSNSDSFRC